MIWRFRLLITRRIDCDDGVSMNVPLYSAWAMAFPKIERLGLRSMDCGCRRRWWRRTPTYDDIDCEYHGLPATEFADLWAEAKARRAERDQ